KPSDEPYLAVGPVFVKLGHNPPATARGWLARSGYAFSLWGDAELQPLLQFARTLGVAAPQSSATGSVRMDLLIVGRWTGFAPPTTTGTLQLRGMRTELRGLNGPLEVASANLHVSPQSVAIEDVSAVIADGHWTGSLELPRSCNPGGLCPVSFQLHV